VKQDYGFKTAGMIRVTKVSAAVFVSKQSNHNGTNKCFPVKVLRHDVSYADCNDCLIRREILTW